VQAVGLDLYESSTTQVHRLGERIETTDGRVFRYAKAGASALVAGNVIQSSAQVTTHKVMTPSAAAIGATSVSATLGATNAVTENQYADGYLIVCTTPGNGYAYRISSHPAAAASAACVFTLAEPLNVALTTSSRVSLQANAFKGVIQSPVTTLTGSVVGVAVVAAAANEFCWLQTRGVAPVLTAGTPGVGLAVVVPATAAGAVVIDGAASATQVIGSMMETGVDGLNCAVFLNLE
jgi:hypothetical protein